MFKILTAAMVAASVAIAPMTVTANAAQPATKTAITTQSVKLVKHHRRHVVKHHGRKHVKHVRHMKRHGLQLRHGKLVRAHRHAHVAAKIVKAPRIRAN